MAFLITAVIRADVDSWLSRYLNADLDGWVPTEVGAFQTESWPVVEREYNTLIQAAQDNSITGREASKVLKEAFAPMKQGKLMVVERVLKPVTTMAVMLK